MSPCANICTLDDDKYCMGCFRHVEEIVGWARMTPTEQWAVVSELKKRAAAKAGAKQ